MAYKREDWNDLLSQINEVLMNPPAGTDCEELNITPLPLVGPGHKWSAADIQAARDKIIQTCESIQFEESLDKWRSAVVNELQTKLLDAWCDCSHDSTWSRSSVRKASFQPRPKPDPS